MVSSYVVALTGSIFCACPVFLRIFFLVVVTWLPDVTKGHLTPSGFPLVFACATPFRRVLGVLYDVRVL